MSPRADQNLLFGLLALQMDLLSREQLLDGFQAWMLRKDTPVAEVLRQRGTLQAEEVEAVAVLMRCRLARHDGDTPRSLAGLSVSTPLESSLRALGDVDVTGSVDAWLRARDDSVYRPTSAPAVDRATVMRYHPLRDHAKGGLGEVQVALDVEL